MNWSQKKIIILKNTKKIYRRIKAFLFAIFVSILYWYCCIDRLKFKKNSTRSILFMAGFGKYGGTRTYVENLITILEKYNCPVYFLQNKNNIDAAGLRIIKNKNIIYLDYNYSFDTPFKIFISIININKIIKNNNINTLLISEGDCGYYVPCTLLQTENILIEHTIPLGKLAYYKQKMLCKAKNNTKIICVSHFQKSKTIENWGNFLSDYCSVVYNSGSFDSTVPFKTNPILTHKKKIITVAHFIEYKNPEMWLSIAKKLTQKYNELEFIWIGDGKDLFSYQDTIRENHAIKLLGYRNLEQIKEEYANAFLYLAVSKIENLAISVIDALYSGLPAIVSNTGGLPEIVDSGKSGFVISTEEEAIEKIELLLSDQALYFTMRENSIARYNTLFSKMKWEEAITSTIFSLFI